MTKARIVLGREGEALAAAYLEAHGFRIVERNYRTALGEIDLIAERRGARHFIEVKTRHEHAAGDPLEQVTPRKQRQIFRAALVYCQRKHLRNPDIHFSVISVDCAGAAPVVLLLEDAFDVPESTPYL